MSTGTAEPLDSHLHQPNITFVWLQILVYQKLVTEQVTDDIEVMTAELKVKVQITDLKLVIELLGLIMDFLMVVMLEEMSEGKQSFYHHL